jgi:hypothetical protein
MDGTDDELVRGSRGVGNEAIQGTSPEPITPCHVRSLEGQQKSTVQCLQ